MKILIGIALIATQSFAGPIVDSGNINILNQRRADAAKAQGVTLTPTPTLSSSPSGGLNTSGSFYKATVLTGGSTGATGAPTAPTVKCKSPADFEDAFQKIIAGFGSLDYDRICDQFKPAANTSYQYTPICEKMGSKDIVCQYCRTSDGYSDIKIKVIKLGFDYKSTNPACSSFQLVHGYTDCWSNGCGDKKHTFIKNSGITVNISPSQAVNGN